MVFTGSDQFFGTCDYFRMVILRFIFRIYGDLISLKGIFENETYSHNSGLSDIPGMQCSE